MVVVNAILSVMIVSEGSVFPLGRIKGIRGEVMVLACLRLNVGALLIRRGFWGVLRSN